MLPYEHRKATCTGHTRTQERIHWQEIAGTSVRAPITLVITSDNEFSTLKVFSSFPAQSHSKISPSLCTVRGESYLALVTASLIKASGGSLAKTTKQKDTEQPQEFYNSWLLLIFSLSSRTVNCMIKSYKVPPTEE